MSQPCLVMVAPNGARRTKDDHPELPIRAVEVAEDAARCAKAGAGAIHLHARDGKGAHSLNPVVCASFLEGVRRRVGDAMLVQLTTEAVGRHTFEQQTDLVRRLKPAAVSLALREIVPEGVATGAAAAFLARLDGWGVAPQYILYDPNDVERFHSLRASGVIPERHRAVLFVLGRHLAKGEEVDPALLDGFLARHDAACPWMVCAFGRHEHAALAYAAGRGGHLRVGFENGLCLADGTTAPDNAAKVAEVAAMLRRLGRPPITGEDAARTALAG